MHTLEAWKDYSAQQWLKSDMSLYELLHVLGDAMGLSFEGKMSPLKSHTWLSKSPWKEEMRLFQHFLHANTPIPWAHF